MTEQAPADQRCYRHRDREAYISCQRCGRKICPDCLRDASVGFHCPESVAEGAKTVRTARTVFGGTVSAREGIASMVIIGMNVAAFVVTLALGGSTGKFFENGAMLSITVGDPVGNILKGVADGGYWRLLTSAFLHEGVLHIAFNMYALYLFGPMVERALGIRRFVGSYLTIAIGASVFVYWLAAPNALTIGASGAVFGLFAMALIFLVKAKQDVTSLLVMLALNAVISLQGNISWQGHLGGFLIGLGLGATFAYAPRERRTQVQILVFVALWIGIIAAVVLRTSQLT
ncbi:MAG: rhomboid family intramembrane serine protease [Aeromicrobium sp.]